MGHESMSRLRRCDGWRLWALLRGMFVWTILSEKRGVHYRFNTGIISIITRVNVQTYELFVKHDHHLIYLSICPTVII